MITERGASMIEIIGVLAIAGLMSAAAIGMYNTIRNNQARKIASTQMDEIVRNTKMLMDMQGDYSGVSVGYLISAGALDNANPPIGGDDWSVVPTFDGAGFSINLTELSSGECEYFATTRPDWATRVVINGSDYTGKNPNCFSSDINQISFFVE